MPLTRSSPSGTGPHALLALSIAAVSCAHPAVDAGRVEWSMGAPSRGHLVRGVRLADRGTGYELFRTPSQGGEPYGTRRLVQAVERAARYVSQRAPGGVPLRVGDLSARRGGHVERHHSHRNGRDVDLIYFALDAATQAPVPAPGFVRYLPDGAARDASVTTRFDVRRNWLLVEALVSDDAAGVLRIFCSTPLRQALLAHARSEGRPASLIARAELVLRQPGDSAAHDDHFHVRVACAPEERARGCVDGGPLWWWLEKAWDKPPVSAAGDDATLLAALAAERADDEPDPPSRAPAGGRRHRARGAAAVRP